MEVKGLRVGRVTLAAGLALAFGLSLAQAQQPSPAQVSAIRSNCRSDFMTNCSGVQPGGQEALECLKRNVAKLSGGCKAAVSAITPAPSAAPAPAAAAPPAAAPAAPNPPVASAPPAAKPAPGKKATAPAHAAAPPAASPPPVAAAPAAAPAVPPLVLRPMLPRRRLVIMEICHADADRLCPGAPRVGPETLDCLAMKAASLSPTCYEALAGVSRP